MPIKGLTLTDTWDLGPVRLHTAASLDAVLASSATRVLDHEVAGPVSREIAEERGKVQPLRSMQRILMKLWIW